MSTLNARPKSLQIGHFYGTNVRSKELAGFNLSETVYPAGMQVPEHYHELPYFCLLLGGGYWERFGGKHVEFEPGSIVFHPEKQIHHGDIRPEPTRCFHLEIESSWIERIAEHGGLPSHSVDRSSGKLAWLAVSLFREFSQADRTSPLMIEALGLEMLARLVRESNTFDRVPPSWLRSAADRVRAEFAESLSVAQIADDLDVSAVRLGRAFRRWHGESIGEFQRRLRVEHVSSRLADPQISLAALAAEAGFSDQSHMTRLFKQATGWTPSRYRNLIRR